MRWREQEIRGRNRPEGQPHRIAAAGVQPYAIKHAAQAHRSMLAPSPFPAPCAYLGVVAATAPRPGSGAPLMGRPLGGS